MPLHLFLGLVPQAVDLLEMKCHHLDHTVRILNGISEDESDKLIDLYDQLQEISGYINETDNQIEQLKIQASMYISNNLNTRLLL